jgi:hypothetical protein
MGVKSFRRPVAGSRLHEAAATKWGKLHWCDWLTAHEAADLTQWRLDSQNSIEQELPLLSQADNSSSFHHKFEIARDGLNSMKLAIWSPK